MDSYTIFIALSIGIAAGILDTIPMIILKMDKFAILSAFLHYLVLGFVIPFVHWEIPQFATGIIISLLSALPVASMVFPSDKSAIAPILITSIPLGAGIGWAASILL